MKRKYICIDLKSFYASVECVERGLDPMTTRLVVADIGRTEKTICLAITPAMKALGIKNRCRIFEIPKGIDYIVAMPRMQKYIDYAAEIYGIYLKYISKDDIHVYSIDEAFLDVTDYLKLYKMTDYELALKILNTVYKQTGLTATCGIGPNMLLAKIAMDVEAKHVKNNIAKWTYDDIKDKLWPITPLSKVWGIGLRMEKRLNNLNIYSIYDLAHYPKEKLKAKFGVIGLDLYNHANGIDNSKIQDFKEVKKEKSISHSQVLFKNYNGSNIKLIIEEMTDILTRRLRENKKQTSCIGLGITYSKEYNSGFYHTTKLDIKTDDTDIILNTFFLLFDKYYNNLPIRKVTLCLSSLSKKDNVQLNLFENINDLNKKDSINSSIDSIKNKFGKNSLVKATALLEDSTALERNKKIGGHNA